MDHAVRLHRESIGRASSPGEASRAWWAWDPGPARGRGSAPATGERFAGAIGREPPRIIENASHFLQEDQGRLIGDLIAEWLSSA